MNNKTIGTFYTILSAASFGIMPIFSALVLNQGTSPFMLTYVRHLSLIPVFAVLVFCTKGSGFKLNKRQAVDVAILSFFGAIVTTSFLYTSYNYIGAVVATGLNFTYPIFVIVLGVLVYKDKATKKVVLCLALCMAGIFFLSYSKESLSVFGIILGLISGIGYGAYALYLDKSRIMESMSFMSYSFYFFLFSSIMFTPILLITDTMKLVNPSMVIVNLTLFCLVGFCATFFFQLGIIRVGSQTVSLLSCLEPVLATILGKIVLNETVNAMKVAGMLLIIVSTLLVSLLKD